MKEESEKKKKKSSFKLHVTKGRISPHCIVDDKCVINICSNNYLNLSNHPKLIGAVKRIVDTHGVSAPASRLNGGTMDVHLELEEKIAEFKGKEDALFYPTGFMVNNGIIPVIVGRDDLILTDELNHGSIIYGSRLSGAGIGTYKHNDMGDLEALLKQSKKYGKRLLITDGVFSTEGDIAPLDEIVKLAKEYDVVTYLDDSHGDGVMGLNGKGTASHFGVEDMIDVAMGGFSKAFGVIGGYLAGSKELIETAKTDSLTWTNTTAPPPTIIAACIAALDVVQTEPQIIKKLWRNTEYYKKSMREMGYDLGKSVTPISPVIVENDKKADRLSQELFKEGVWGGPYKKGLSRIRTIMNAGLEREDIDTVLGVFEKVGKKLDIL